MRKEGKGTEGSSHNNGENKIREVVQAWELGESKDRKKSPK